MGGTVSIDELKQLALQQAQNTSGSNAQLGYPPHVNPVSYPTSTLPRTPIYFPPQQRYVLSDFDIELMAACIANKHPVVEGQSHCFCTLKRLERGISKD